MNLRPYMILCILFGFLSALGDAFYKPEHANPVPYMTAGAGLIGGVCYILLLLLGRFVD